MTTLLTLAASMFIAPNVHAAELCLAPIHDPKVGIEHCYCEGMEIKDAAVEAGAVIIWSASPTRAREFTITNPGPWAAKLAEYLRPGSNVQLCCGYDPANPRECATFATRPLAQWESVNTWRGTVHADVGTARGRIERSL